MDLGCLDLGCISVEKQSTDSVLDSKNKDVNDKDPLSTSSSKSTKNKSLRESQSTLNALNKFTPQIKKPPHRKSSPLNWFPRKKVDSYLKRKIKMLQEVGGMNSTLDETLGDSNPHYSRVLREKIAASEAAHKAMEARKAALVEASWCRILRAARIQSKEAEGLLLKAEKTAAEAFEAATAMGVIMYDKPNCPQKTCQVETSSVNGGGSTTHTVTASFETAFEVDKKVAAAVKTAFSRLANCSSFNKDEFKDLLRKISQNPDTGDNNHELSEFSSECESESGSELDTMSRSQDLDFKVPVVEMRQRKHKRRQSLEKLTIEKLVDMMVERLRCLHEDELSSLVTIVATCGLNAALAKLENSKLHDPGSAADYPSAPAPRRMSSFGSGTRRKPNLEHFLDGQIRRKQPASELPSLDKFLVKHMTKLEREVQEAKNSRRNSKKGTVDNSEKTDDGEVNSEGNITSSETLPDLGSILVKHSSRFEREIEEAKKNSGNNFEVGRKSSVADISSSEAIPDLGTVLTKHSSRLEKEIEETKRKCGKSFELNSMKMERLPSRAVSHTKEDVPEVPSLDKFLVKHVSRLEKEVQEARNSRKNDSVDGQMVTNLMKKVDSSTLDSQFNRNESFSSNAGLVGKENIDLNKEVDRNSEMKKQECAMNLPSPNTIGCTGGETLSLQDTEAGTEVIEDSLDKILVKPVHWLEREKMQASSLGSNYGNHRPQKKQGGNNVTSCESLDKVLVKHVSRLEKEKMRFNASEEVVKVKTSDRNMHSQMNEEGSLDQILVKHKSRLEKEKVAAAQPPGDQIRFSVSRREARERELQEAWGGLSLGNSIRPRSSKLERDKAAWIKAEEEERRQAMREV